MNHRPATASVAQLRDFDEIIDVRSPAEFAADRIPGAINCPALDNEQRARVGTIYKQVSPFEARRLGAAMIARNLSDALFDHFQDKPKSWRPLIYCWRGGQRSGAFVTWFRLTGWDACQLEGGYKRFRRHVVDELARIAPQTDLRVIGGATGSAKTRLLEALAAQGAQVLDLEALAAHKGSVLGDLPGIAQPTQKFFETSLLSRLQELDLARSIFVEAESRRIGSVQIPEDLIERMRASPCLSIEATRPARIEFLLRDYAYLGDDKEALKQKIDAMRTVQSNETLSAWRALADSGDLRALFGEFIDRHYDPLYQRSQNRNFAGFSDAAVFATDDLSPDSLQMLASRITRELR
ncbi:MAG: tRNA 2-selenouridine(34) synthase MnmH [Sterolibacteriaceae bacterium]|uniref:tRNA 2-selenouridine(34) synthase MnmH n=1 Tax=Candidatus Methylophosphatis roskildensis TaxID=2899263 RepID=A0A9D7HM16_9PROT|nr:tRNA 2-selenouridine(34) synthase MnmH [Candidatus Methylophosphatis roskildensis]